MPDTEGGGASPTTEPAFGTSTATDVSLDRFLSREIAWVDRFYRREIEHMRELTTTRREADQLAIRIALDNQKELAEKHNDLIRQGEKKDETYATKADVGRLENWQSKVTGALILIAFVGLANLIKLWTG